MYTCSQCNKVSSDLVYGVLRYDKGKHCVTDEPVCVLCYKLVLERAL